MKAIVRRRRLGLGWIVYLPYWPGPIYFNTHVDAIAFADRMTGRA